MSEKKTSPDWERIELEYRAGILTLREIATLHGITHGAVNKRAKRSGWSRDLHAKVMAKADELVAKKTVSTQVSKKRMDTEAATVHALGYQVAEVKLGRQTRVGRSLVLASRLRDELELVTDNREAFAALGEQMRAPDTRGQDKRNDIYEAVISLPMRIKAAKDLSEIDKANFAMEADAFGLAPARAAADQEPDSPAPTTADPQAYYAWLSKQGTR